MSQASISRSSPATASTSPWLAGASTTSIYRPVPACHWRATASTCSSAIPRHPDVSTATRERRASWRRCCENAAWLRGRRAGSRRWTGLGGADRGDRRSRAAASRPGTATVILCRADRYRDLQRHHPDRTACIADTDRGGRRRAAPPGRTRPSRRGATTAGGSRHDTAARPSSR